MLTLFSIFGVEYIEAKTIQVIHRQPLKWLIKQSFIELGRFVQLT